MNHWLNPADLPAILDAARDATVIWDFDGVVADNEPLQAASFEDILATEIGYRPSPGFFTPLMGHTETRIWELIREAGAPIVDIPAIIEQRRARYLRTALATLRPSWLAAELMPAINSLAARQVVLSNGDERANSALLTHWGLDRYVETISKPDGQSKSSLLPGLCTAKTISIEDNAGYLNRAHAMGAFTIGVIHSMSRPEPMSADVKVTI